MIGDQPITLVHPDSLGDTIDAINAALFEPVALSQGTCSEAALWLADRQGLPGRSGGSQRKHPGLGAVPDCRRAG